MVCASQLKLFDSCQRPSTTPLPEGSEPELTILAKTIQNLVDSLPLDNTTLQPCVLSPYPLPPSPTPEPQPQLKDSRLAALLSNASFMNGSSLKGKPSIWSILENIRPITSSPNPATTSTAPHNSEIQQGEPRPLSPTSNIYHSQISNESSIFSDTSSIMVYSPLFPTQSDFVELAELVPFNTEFNEEVQSEIESERTMVNPDPDTNLHVGSRSKSVGGDSQEGQGVTSWTLMWPFSIWYGPDQSGRSAEITTSSQVGTSNNLDAGSPTTNQTIRPVKSHKSIPAWVPSSSKISVQAFWWGYRLYLPPPVLEILSDKTLEATKRSAVITTALTWFFNNLPVDVFPPPMKPALILLQRLVPLLGYIGTFISWSWNTIRSYDVGYGVTLTATWILPVALIPATWYERDFPKSPIPNSPIPLPRPLSMQSFVVPSTPTTLIPDRDIPSSVYATPMSSVVFNSPPLPPDGETRGFDSSLASSSTSRSWYSPLSTPRPILTPIPSSSIHYPTTDPPDSSSSSSLYLTPNSSTPTTLPHHSGYQPPTPTSPVPTLVTRSTPISSPKTRAPHLNTTRLRSSSPLINSSIIIPPPLTIHNAPRSHTTPALIPIPIPPTPTELPPIPPEPPFSPKLVNLLLRGPVLQTVPLPDVDDSVNGGVGVGVGLDGGSGGDGGVDLTRRLSLWKKNAKIESSSSSSTWRMKPNSIVNSK